MSLDSVLLIVEFENYFNVEIANADAEKIGTVQNAVDHISKLKNIRDAEKPLYHSTLNRLQTALHKLRFSRANVSEADLVCKFIAAEDKQNWKDLETILHLKIPDPFYTEGNFITNFLFGKGRFEYAKLTFSELVDVICAENYESLIDPKKIKTNYEILIAVTGITASKLGAPIYSIKSGRSFTGDLGID